jgi:hypothetical protein
MPRGDQRSHRINRRLIGPDARHSLTDLDVGDDEASRFDDPATEVHDSDEIPTTMGRAGGRNRRHLARPPARP